MAEQTASRSTGAVATSDASSNVNVKILHHGPGIITVIRYEQDFDTDDSSREAYAAIQTLRREAQQEHGVHLLPETLKAYMLSHTERFTDLAPGFTLQSVGTLELNPESLKNGSTLLASLEEKFLPTKLRNWWTERRRKYKGDSGFSGA